MEPYRTCQPPAREAAPVAAPDAADDLVVLGVIFVVGAVVAGSGLLAEPAMTTPGTIGLMMMMFAMWSFVSDALSRLVRES